MNSKFVKRLRIVNASFLLLALVVLQTFAAQGCAAGRRTQSIEAELSDVRRELRAVKEQNFNLQRELDRLQKTLAEQENLQRQNKADFSAQIEALRTQIEAIQNQLQDSNYRISVLSEKLGVFKFPEPVADFQQARRDTAAGAPETSTPVVGVDESRELYNTAYADLIRGNYQLALHGFQQFLRQYPNSDLSDNAQYWIGEIYYAQGRYQDAITEFEKVIKRYPNGDKIPAVLLKIGYAYINMEELEQGRLYLQEVIDQYPNSQEAKLAQGRLQALK